MRLWHKDLIPVLPSKQLVSQWRELSAISGEISIHGTLKHPLVKPLLDYTMSHYYLYAQLVLEELKNRGYKMKDFVWDKITSIVDKDCKVPNLLWHHELYAGWHNRRYMMQCICNLQEKYDCGMITGEEWDNILSIPYVKYMQNLIKEICWEESK